MPMNRQRSLPANDFSDPTIGSLPPEIRLTAIGLRMIADDEGRGQVRIRPMVAELYEHDESMTSEEMQRHLVTLNDSRFLTLYTAEGLHLYQIRMWPPVDHPKASRFPPPEGFSKPSRSSHETFAAVEREGASGSESGGARAWAGAPSHERAPSRSPLEEPSAPEPPSPFCSQHQPYGIEAACGPCGTARMAHDIWQRAAMSVSLPQRAQARTPAADPVEYLDDEGRIETT